MTFVPTCLKACAAGAAAFLMSTSYSATASAQDFVSFLWGGDEKHGGGRKTVAFSSQYKPGQIIVSAALVDDVLGLVLLAVLTALIKTGELPGLASIAWLVAEVVLFFAICTTLGLYVLPRLARRLKGLLIEEMEFSMLLVVAFGFSMLAEARRVRRRTRRT